MSKLKVPRALVEHVKRGPDDFTLQTFRCGGNGGQNVNKRETGVRIIDKVTGLTAESCEHRTQWQNRKAAFERLAERIVEHYKDKFRLKREVETTVIRTYKFPSFALDHRTKKKYALKTVLDGDLQQIHEDLLDE